VKIRAIVAATSIAAAGALGASAVAAAYPADGTPGKILELGERGVLNNNGVVQGWTITDLRPSTDTIPYQVQGTLWEATATDEAIHGAVTPIVSNLNARAGDGPTYRALFFVATPQGVNPATLPEGQKTTGKVYFDVTGPAPDRVVYNDGVEDLLVWVQAADDDIVVEEVVEEDVVVVEEGTEAVVVAEEVTEEVTETVVVEEVPAGSAGTPVAGANSAEDAATTPGTTTTTTAEDAGTEPTPAAGSAGTPVQEASPLQESLPVEEGTPHGTAGHDEAAPTTTTTPVPTPAA